MKNFLIRTATSIVFVIIVIASILGGKVFAFLLFGFFIGTIFFESRKLFKFKNNFSLILYIILSLLFYYISVYGSNKLTPTQWGALILIFLLSAFIVVSTNNLNISNLIAHTGLFFYVTIPFICYLRTFDLSVELYNNHNIIPITIIGMIWINDSSSYISGMLFGKRKAFPKISPGKTWGGYILGFLTSIVVMIMFWAIVNEISLIHCILFAIISYVFGSIGDLIESSLKRKANLKDLSKILPGHGGVFDRFDSFIFAIPFLTLLILTLYP
ncbi:MAG: phosphatidate cytidylyltransferase [Bacteroidales bacterium]|jgi:phosphatidate cytidylyltransferase